MTDHPHPLTETRAAELWDARLDGSFWRELNSDQKENALTDMRSGWDAALEATLAVAPADPHHDARPWRDCTREDIREGDLVETQNGMTTLRIGVAHRKNESGDWYTKDGWMLTDGDRWPLRRIPAPTPPTLDPLADLTPGTTIRDVALVGPGAVGDAFIVADASGPYVATAYGFHFLSFLTAFTTDDRKTRYTRHGDTWTAETLDGDA